MDLPELSSFEPLTESEVATLRLAAQGVENQEIAQALNYSVHAVASRLRTIYEKLHVANRTQAALYTLRQGWAVLDESLAQDHLAITFRSPLTVPITNYSFKRES